jgi:CRP/FNR family cyclic AMP-dependent transcriptional regulator
MNASLSSALDASTPRQERSVFDLHALLDSVGIGATISDHDASDVIFSQGDPARHVMYIQRGMVKKSVMSRAGKEAIVAVLGPGEFFGEECLAGQPERMATVSAMTASTVLTIDKRQMLGMLHRHAALADWFEEVLLGADESRERAVVPRPLAEGAGRKGR